MARLVALAFLASGLALNMQGDHTSKQLAAAPMWMYKSDCFQKRPVSLAQGANVPGAGVDKFEPFKTVLKDGYLEAACVKDYMYYHGDKFGDNKHSYELEKTAQVSIVHYEAHVAKEDRKAMSPTVCFEFCRTVPNMGFYGIVNGRGCYCTPYYKPMESDSSNCDSVCEGDSTLMCGGKDKSTVFGMHMCANTAQDLSDASGKADAVIKAMNDEVTAVKGLSTDMQGSATKLQASFGAVGDSATTNLVQSAKVFAGDLEHTAEDAEKIAAKLKDLHAEAGTVGKTDFSDPKQATKAENVVEDIEGTLKKADAAVKKLDEVKDLAEPPTAAKGAAKQYYPVMYFVDKEHENTPQTCGGDVVAKPIVGADLDSCATACDKHTTDCVGFSYYGGDKSLCFLFRKFTSAFYYTGCGAAKKAFMLLQSAQEAAPFDVKCMAKFSEFEGTTLKPDGSGKCKKCLKDLTKADRCYK